MDRTCWVARSHGSPGSTGSTGSARPRGTSFATPNLRGVPQDPRRRPRRQHGLHDPVVAPLQGHQVGVAEEREVDLLELGLLAQLLELGLLALGRLQVLRAWARGCR